MVPQLSMSPRPGGESSALATKVREVTELRIDAPDVAESLAYIGASLPASTFSGNSNNNNNSALRADIRLRGELEMRAIENANEFLASYEALAKSLDEIECEANALAAEAAALDKAAAQALEGSRPLLEEVEQLAEEKVLIGGYTALAEAFSAKYRLTPQEIRALTKDEVGPELLCALHRAEEIRGDCKQLLQTSHHRIAIDIMSEMSSLIEDALWRLAAWVRRTLASSATVSTAAAAAATTTTDDAGFDPMLTQSLAALRMSEMYEACLDDLAAQRSKALAQEFISALSVGSRTQRPIEIHIHDPLRYVGDMLAWVHQAAASEYELVAGLLMPSASLAEPTDEREIARKSAAITTSTTTTAIVGRGNRSPARSVQRVLEQEFEALCRPFRIRLGQVLAMSPGAVILFKLSGVLSFYAQIVEDFLGPESPLPSCLVTCEGLVLDALATQLKDIVAKLSEALPVPSADLLPPVQVREVAGLISELVDSLGSSVAASRDDMAKQLSPALDILVAPLPDILSRAAATAGKLDATATAVFMVNALSSILVPLVPAAGDATVLAAVEPVAQALHKAISNNISALVSGQAARFLSDCGIAKKLAVIHNFAGDKAPASSVLGLEVAGIESTARAFEAALVSTGVTLLQPHVDRLLNPRYRAILRKGVAEEVAAAYTELYVAVTAPEAGYPNNGARIFRYTPDQVRVLLGI